MLHDGMSRIAFSDGWQRDLFDRAAAPCWARIGQFYAEVACREAGAVFLDQWMQKTGRNYCAVGFASSRITHHENPMEK